MICGIIKWMISQSLDADGRISSFVERHIEKCPSCRHFVAASRLIGDRLESDARRLNTKPVFVNELDVQCNYSLRLAVLTACILIMSGILMVNSVRTTTGGGGMPTLGSILPQEGLAGLLSGSGIPATILDDGIDGCLGKEVDYLAQDVRSAAAYIAGSLPFGVWELN
ncbi:MAG: hypothetical protein A2283_09555 [Lentisphaerae bacterium RIFOXYA12_FULL_48_11]|nr:MAG: hypothetical protein A2283_09555 [Lentisphaerae bacterium RIFOXYA12_FULL_48_11]